MVAASRSNFNRPPIFVSTLAVRHGNHGSPLKPNLDYFAVRNSTTETIYLGQRVGMNPAQAANNQSGPNRSGSSRAAQKPSGAVEGRLSRILEHSHQPAVAGHFPMGGRRPPHCCHEDPQRSARRIENHRVPLGRRILTGFFVKEHNRLD